MVPAMYNLFLLALPTSMTTDLQHWRIGGLWRRADAAVHNHGRLSEKLPNLCLMNAYGANRAYLLPLTILPMGSKTKRAGQHRIAVPCRDIRIVDPQGPMSGTDGTHGELWTRARDRARHWDNPDRTASEFH